MGKVALGALGGVFCLFQVAAYYGYVKVDMAKVERDFTAVLDVNKDGKVDQDDLRALRVWWSRPLFLKSSFRHRGMSE